MVFFTVASIAVFTWFIISTVTSLGHVPFSISDSYYALDSKGSIFVLVLLLIVALMSPVLTHFGWLGLAILLGICCVACCPKFRDSKIQNRVHYTGAIVAMICSFILTLKISPLGFLAWLPTAIWFVRSKIHKHTDNCGTWEIEIFDKTDWLWWLEIGSFYSLWLSLLLK